VLYILGFKLSFAFPGFLDFKLSDIPILIGSFTLGPVSGGVIVVVEILIKLVVKGTTTMFVGELSDLITSCVFAVTAGIIYKRHRTFKGALVAMAVGTVAEVTVALLINWLVLVPFYAQVFGWDMIVFMMKPLFPACTKAMFFNYYLWVSVLPFNLLRCLIAVGVTLLVYKRISRMINSVNRKIYGKPDHDEAKSKKMTIILICVGVAVVALLITFALLRKFVF
ncbi:MAG: ECF transporter S component, partial [Clostridiales bacterium]|nr:ECF transporter S component [Clostridiales bacterium]